MGKALFFGDITITDNLHTHHNFNTRSFMSLLHLSDFTRNITQLCGRGMDFTRYSLTDGSSRVKDVKRWVKRGVETKVLKGIAVEGWRLAGGRKYGGTEELAMCGKTFGEGLEIFMKEVEGKWGIEDALGFLVPFRGIVVKYCGFIEEFTSKGTAGMFGLEGVYGRVDKVREEVSERDWRWGRGILQNTSEGT